MNNGIITAFVSTMGCLQRMSKEEDDVWRTLVAALAKGNKPLNLSFRFNEDGWSRMTAEWATELISYLLLSISKFYINNADFGVGMINVVITNVAKTTAMTVLYLNEIPACVWPM